MSVAAVTNTTDPVLLIDGPEFKLSFDMGNLCEEETPTAFLKLRIDSEGQMRASLELGGDSKEDGRPYATSRGLLVHAHRQALMNLVSEVLPIHRVSTTWFLELLGSSEAARKELELEFLQVLHDAIAKACEVEVRCNWWSDARLSAVVAFKRNGIQKFRLSYLFDKNEVSKMLQDRRKKAEA